MIYKNLDRNNLLE